MTRGERRFRSITRVCSYGCYTMTVLTLCVVCFYLGIRLTQVSSLDEFEFALFTLLIPLGMVILGMACTLAARGPESFPW